MKDCPRCQTPVPDEAHLCPRCGTVFIDWSAAPTVGNVVPPSHAPTRSAHFTAASQPAVPIDSQAQVADDREAPAPSRTSALRVSGPGQFGPGTVIAERYQIVGLLGRGGMGEVYRADDQRLGIPVALKFLFPGDTDLDSLGRLFSEVKIAREVSHPNVCRVHDVGEFRAPGADGRDRSVYFISMEYVDGEPLSGLLKRIGRFPGDRALDVARELCAGLAAAHERGVLHRDLKPANVMIDGRGRVKLMDFGLSGYARELARGVAAGTPAFMAPEQLLKGGATVQSDVFSLGLVLYELFTGKPAYTPKTLEDLRAQHEQPVVPPSTIVPSIDPDAEAAILHCLEIDPVRRPRSALEVLGLLPGGDPLAAAMAAGETPSVTLVANAGRKHRVAAGLVGAWLGLAGVCLALLYVLFPKVMLLPRLPLEFSGEVLTAKAREIVAALGYEPQRRHAVGRFDLFEEYLRLVEQTDLSPQRWDRLTRPRPGAIDFWYRQHPGGLAPLNPSGIVSWDDPPMRGGGIDLRLDALGRLRELRVTPERAGDDSQAVAWLAQRGTDPAPLIPPEPDPAPLFQAAGLDFSSFTAATPARIPYTFADTRRAWEGVYPESPDTPVRIEAGWLEGKPVEFRTVELNFATPLDETARRPQGNQRVAEMFDAGLRLVTLLGALGLAWRNWRLQRGDFRGATRTGAVMGGLALLVVLHRADTFAAPADGPGPLITGLQQAVFVAALVWVIYIGLEPYVRRVWPETLIGWSRLINGRWRDPFVGYSLLTGVAVGLVCQVLSCLSHLSAQWLGHVAPRPYFEAATSGPPLQNIAGGLSTVFLQMISAGILGMAILLSVALARMITNRFTAARWPAIAAIIVVQTIIWGLLAPANWAAWALSAVIATVALTTMVRLGLLAFVTGLFTFNLAGSFPITADVTAWYFGIGLAAVLLIGALAGAGAVVAVSGISTPGGRR